MGIKKLSKFLLSHNIVNRYESFDNYVSQNVNLLQNNYIRICIDASLYIHKYIHSYNDIVFGFMNQILRLLSTRIMPVYVFDGKPPAEKAEILKSRLDRKIKINDKIKTIENILNNMSSSSDEKDTIKNDLTNKMNKLKRQASSVNKNDIENLKRILDIIGIPYICAKGEADIICAELTKMNVVSACLSDDMDLLPYGCTKLLRLIDGNIYEYDLNKILMTLQLTYEQFVEMCIIIGCDYIKNFKLNPEIAYENIKKYNNVNAMPNINNIVSIEEINNVKKIFIDSNVNYFCDIKETIYFDFVKVSDFLKENNYITSIDYLNKYRYKINLINKNSAKYNDEYTYKTNNKYNYKTGFKSIKTFC
jgi:flap endonuclease-1